MFLKTYSDYHTNGANRSYWAKFFKTISKELQETNKIHLYSSYNEDMPIFEYHSAKKGRYVRIMQYNPLDEMIKSQKYPTKRFYTAWIDKRLGTEAGMAEPELVVCLLMTRTNITKAETLIRAWFFESESQTEELIKKIYNDQDRMDKELSVN